MIEIDEFRLPITPEEARSYISSQTDNFGIFFDVDRLNEYAAILALENRDLEMEAIEISRDPSLSLRSKSSKQLIIKALISMGVNPVEFTGGSYTAGIRQHILDAVDYSPAVKELVCITDTYISNKRNIGALDTYAKLPMSCALSKENHRMSLARPKWSLLNTSRIAASDPGIQGIPRSMGDIICEPKGYTLIRCDSGQIEPRINFSCFFRDELIMKLITHYNDAYFGLLNYCKMTDEEEKACRVNFEHNFKPLEITDDIKDMRQNIKTLTNAGSYGSSNLGNINASLAKVYEAKIVKHPARLAYERKVTQDVERGIDTFYGMFGTPVKPGATEKYSVGDDGWKNHLIRCGINNPTQTTASELMMFSVNKAREIISRAKDTHICYYKHDEACFYVSDEDMANGIGDELSDVTAYKVKGWIPIYSDTLIGRKHSDYPSYL